MSDKVVLDAKERNLVGKKVKQLKNDGLVPGVVYGKGMDSLAIAIDEVLAEKAFKAAGKSRPVELTVGKVKKLTMIKSADRDPVKRKLRHLSFHAIKQNEKVEAEVAIKIANEGSTAAEQAGLIVLQSLEMAQIEALPANLPEWIEVASDKLVNAGDQVTVADIVPVDGVVVLNDPELTVATVYEPAAIAAQNEAAAGDAEEAAPASEEETATEEEGENAQKVE